MYHLATTVGAMPATLNDGAPEPEERLPFRPNGTIPCGHGSLEIIACQANVDVRGRPKLREFIARLLNLIIQIV